MATTAATDMFLSHDWGEDRKTNHEKVARINKALQQLGYTTWFDQERMTGNIKDQIANGIENTKCFIAFITEKYHNKVVHANDTDYCRLEFNYASNKGIPMIAIVLESSMKDTGNWKGNVGLSLSTKMYVNMTGDIYDQMYLTKQLGLLRKMLDDKNIRPSNNLKSREKGKNIFFYIYIPHLLFAPHLHCFDAAYFLSVENI